MFGTDGIRGVVDIDIDTSLAYNIGKAISLYIEKSNLRKEVIIGYDTRVSNHTLTYALSVGIMDYGVDVSIVGVVPTAAISYLSRNNNAIGVMITASHNSKEYNGIKIIGNDGFKLNDSNQKELEKLVTKKSAKSFYKGKLYNESKYKTSYIEHLNRHFNNMTSSYKVVFDTAHGANSDINKTILKYTGLDFIVINNKPNGLYINDNVGAQYVGYLKNYVVNDNNSIGFAFDGDADRLRVVDSSGYVYSGDEIIYILALYLKKINKLYRNTVVGTTITSKSLETSLHSLGIQLVRVPVGDKNVIECMQSNGYALGGEESGHICMLEYNTTSDALFNALYLLKVLEYYKKPLKHLLKGYRKYDRISHNISVSKEYKDAFLSNSRLQKVLQDYILNHNDYSIIIRPSGTENIIRLVVEGNKSGFDKIIKDISSLIIEK